MTHSLINVLATFSTAGHRYVEDVSKIVIITLAIVLVAKEQKKYFTIYLTTPNGLLENGKSTAELGKAIYLANMLGLDIGVNARGK